MSNCYEQVFRLPENLYLAGSPVSSAAGALNQEEETTYHVCHKAPVLLNETTLAKLTGHRDQWLEEERIAAG